MTSCLPSSEFPSSPSVSSPSRDPCWAPTDGEAGALRQSRLVSGDPAGALPVALFSGVSTVAEGFDFEELVNFFGAIFGRRYQVASRKGQYVRDGYEERD
jgi:hypothetical protein